MLLLGLAPSVSRGQVAQMMALSFAGDGNPARVWRIDPYAPSATLIGSSGFSRCNAAAVDSLGRLFTVGRAPGAIASTALVTINPTTGVGTQVATLNFGGAAVDIRALAFASSTVLYAVNNQVPSQISP